MSRRRLRRSAAVPGHTHEAATTIMNSLSLTSLAVILSLALVAPAATSTAQAPMVVRIAEVDIDPKYLTEYTAILRRGAAAAMRLEPGVISIFPMFEQEHPTRIRILEIYADRAAYEAHLKTPHFLEYKSTTLKMVTSLRLVDMSAIDPETMAALFRKMP